MTVCTMNVRPNSITFLYNQTDRIIWLQEVVLNVETKDKRSKFSFYKIDSAEVHIIFILKEKEQELLIKDPTSSNHSNEQGNRNTKASLNVSKSNKFVSTSRKANEVTEIDCHAVEDSNGRDNKNIAPYSCLSSLRIYPQRKRN